MSARILHVTDAFPPEHGGVERVVEQLAAGQAARGCRVIVLTKALADAPAAETRPDGVRVFRYPHAARPTPWVYATTWHATRRLAQGLWWAEKPDLVHYHLTLSAQGPLSVFGDRLPSVYTFYGPWHAEFAIEAKPLLDQASPLYRRYLQAQIRRQEKWQKRLLNRARRVVVLSEFSRTHISRLAPSRAPGAVLIPGGIDPQRFQPGDPDDRWQKELALPEDAFVLLTVRRLVERTGIDLLLDAVAEIAKEKENVFCLIAGNGPARDALAAQAQRLGLAGHVRFLGFVPEDRLPDLYRLADLFVVPTRAEENFGLIVLEAAACGTPVAATPAGSLPELMRATDPRYLAEDVSAPALAKVIRRAREDGRQAKDHFRLSVSPRVREQFSWSRIVSSTLALYEEMGVT